MKTALAGLGLSLALLLSASGAPDRLGTVLLSNGDLLQGKLSLTPGEDLRLHVGGNQIRALDFSRVRLLRLVPAEEKMVQRWRFLEAGQTKKEAWGQPYLIRNLQATVVLADGEKCAGHLYTTVLYLAADERVRKFVLPAKQRGKEGENGDALVYPAQITFLDSPAPAEETTRLHLAHPDLSAQSTVTALAWGSLLNLDVKSAGTVGDYALAGSPDPRVFLAAKTGSTILVGWPAPAAPAFTALVQTNLANNEDFFDDRRLLGVFYDQSQQDLYSLLSLGRRGKTTLEGEKAQPWRLVILRWKYDPETQRLLLAGRGCLARSLLASGEPPPAVKLTEALWRSHP
jgi:hypothetical protein